MKEPTTHKDLPGRPEDLKKYRKEVCEGIKDHLVRKMMETARPGILEKAKAMAR